MSDASENIVKVLFIDDEEDLEFVIRQKLRKRMRDGKMELLFARDGAEGLKVLEKNPDIGLVFTDINMPVMDGIAFLQALKGPEWKDRLFKVVVISAYGNMKNIRHAMNSGAFDFINKPIDFEDLEKTLDKSLAELDELTAGREAERKLNAAIREKELAEASEKLKEDFFANITHELRTPLTLIMGPVDRMIRRSREHDTKEQLKVVRRNSRRLLQLINQLLDISRIEAGSMGLRLFRTDIVDLARETIGAFEGTARQKDITLGLNRHPDKLEMDLDPEKILNVLSNLLSNALKFTPAEGKVMVDLLLEDSGKTLRMSVKDSGIGIPEKDLPHIFDRFYRVEGREGGKSLGTGIGLALCQELISLHGGTLEVKSIEGMGSEFVARIPIREEAIESFDVRTLTSEAPELVPDPVDDSDESPQEISSETPTILVVEDNPDMQQHIRNTISDEYLVLLATNGKMGLEMAKDHVPDLVISDVMMPEMNGYEFCEYLKTNDMTSHIPVILLTAKAGMDEKLQGLETGADDYLTKPFESRELLSRVRNLISLRQKLREHFRNEFLMKPGAIEATSREEAFLLKIKEIVHEHLADEQFGVEALCREVGMSRTQVHRKLKALTGQSASHLIRTYRLETAMAMLKKDTGTIAEIAYDVGFSSPSYFTKCFTDHFSMTPREARKAEAEHKS